MPHNHLLRFFPAAHGASPGSRCPATTAPRLGNRLRGWGRKDREMCILYGREITGKRAIRGHLPLRAHRAPAGTAVQVESLPEPSSFGFTRPWRPVADVRSSKFGFTPGNC